MWVQDAEVAAAQELAANMSVAVGRLYFQYLMMTNLLCT